MHAQPPHACSACSCLRSPACAKAAVLRAQLHAHNLLSSAAAPAKPLAILSPCCCCPNRLQAPTPPAPAGYQKMWVGNLLVGGNIGNFVVDGAATHSGAWGALHRHTAAARQPAPHVDVPACRPCCHARLRRRVGPHPPQRTPPVAFFPPRACSALHDTAAGRLQPGVERRAGRRRLQH